MHVILSLLLIAILLWIMFPKVIQKPNMLLLPGEELYVNEPSEIQFTNAEFKFYK